MHIIFRWFHRISPVEQLSGRQLKLFHGGLLRYSNELIVKKKKSSRGIRRNI